jgi:hypothetical protein
MPPVMLDILGCTNYSKRPAEQVGKSRTMALEESSKCMVDTSSEIYT